MKVPAELERILVYSTEKQCNRDIFLFGQVQDVTQASMHV
jgi:hypothetical protein